ncbi:polysaccharide deacetylase family protein [Streptomyces sp. Tu 3180]|uniref:polysaccharide deacetylase family protein n=1 Tax=Streptomyces sp. Tu 3180 TaxID=2682611 RepID=UPI001356F18B|nr:polysaccharide deacetylase family protein [Streptomyces sp. Tu 3180]KAF3467035.1 polysaccharide deacetylase family protein [Streptomyces sp. Tu 3180]
MRRRGARTALLAAVALLAALAGCGPSAGPGAGTAAPGAGESGAGDGAGQSPGDGPAPGGGVPPVVDHVPTEDEVVFLTYDDGAERDPRFIDLVRERRLPVSMFLTDSVVGPGYAHFARLRAVGASLQNHTLDHPALRGLPYAGQRAEICGQQRKLASRFGVRPHLFRPPHGTYDATTLRAAADCGITAVVLWRVTLEGDGGLTYTHGAHRLAPGDIVSVPSAGTPPLSLAERTTRLLREVEEQGLRVGRLEDHLRPARPPGA